MRGEYFHDNICDLKLTQNPQIDKAFHKLKSVYGQPVNIIEIGTCWGGFAVFLAQMFPDSSICTFDVKDWGDYKYVEKRDERFSEYLINYFNEDCFLNDGRTIKSLLKSKSILLCDGAHKEQEFSFFSDFIEEDSVIMAHDYGKNEKYFREHIQGKYWNHSFEFDGSKFDQVCTEKKLITFLQSDFDKAVWYIRKKIH